MNIASGIPKFFSLSEFNQTGSVTYPEIWRSPYVDTVSPAGNTASS